MSGSRSPFTYLGAIDPSTGLSHPFTGLPLEVVGALGDTGVGGVNGYFNHFNSWEGPVADVASPGTAGWIVSGTGNAGSVTVRDSAQHGILRMLTGSTENDVLQMQLAGSGFRYVAGKRMWVAARFALEDANDGEFAFGLAIETDVDVINTLPSDGFFFEKSETATDLDFHCRLNGTSTEKTSIGLTLADATFVIVGFCVDAVGNVIPFAGTSLSTASVLSSKVVAAGNANICTDEDLTLFAEIQTGAAATRYADFDWLLAFQER